MDTLHQNFLLDQNFLWASCLWGCGGQWLLSLRLQTAGNNSLSWRIRHDDHVVHRPECAGHVAGLRRGNVRSLLAGEAGSLTQRQNAFGTNQKQS